MKGQHDLGKLMANLSVWYQAATPMAFSTTNNPLEHAWKDYKANYFKGRPPLPGLLRGLKKIVEKDVPEFKGIEGLKVNSDCIMVHRHLAGMGLLEGNCANYILVGANDGGRVIVKQHPTNQFRDAYNLLQLNDEEIEELNNHPKHSFVRNIGMRLASLYKQPDEGWHVDMNAKSCQCLVTFY